MSWLRGVKGLVGKVSRGSGDGGQDGHSSESGGTSRYVPASSDVSPELAQLRTKFFDYELLQNDADKERELLPLLVMFCKVFEDSDPRDTARRFGREAIRSFSFYVSRNAVKAIRARASSQSTEDASLSLANFFSTPNQLGIVALETLNRLVAGGDESIEPMVSMALPSTLVKTLYLFYDIPVPPTAEKKVAWERMQNRFTRLTTKLVENLMAIEELVRTDDLARLYDMLISDVPLHNESWRHATATIINAIAAKGLTSNSIGYIQKKGCVARCLAALHKSRSTSPTTVVDILEVVLGTIAQSSRFSQSLLDDFRTCHGYPFLTDFMLSQEEIWRDQDCAILLGRMVSGISALVYCGYVDLRPSLQLLSNPYQDKGFSLPLPLGNGRSVRNTMAYHVLHSLFLKCNTEQLKSIVLDNIFRIFGNDPANYFITESQHSVALFIEIIDDLQPSLRRQVLKLLEHIVCNLNFVPFPELASLSIKLKVLRDDALTLVLLTLIKFVEFDSKFRDIFRAVGIMDSLVALIIDYDKLGPPGVERVDEGVTADTQKADASMHEGLGLLAKCIAAMATNNPANAELLRQGGVSKALFNMVYKPWAADAALCVIQQLVLDNSRDAADDLTMLLEKLQSVPSELRGVKISLMKTFLKMFHKNSRIRRDFYEAQGFVYIISTLLSIRDSDGNVATPVTSPSKTNTHDLTIPETDNFRRLLESTFEVLTMALHDSRINQALARQEKNYDMLRDTVKSSGLLLSKYFSVVLDCVFNMACEGFGRRFNWNDLDSFITQIPVVINADVLQAFIPLLPQAPLQSRIFLERLRLLITHPSNAQTCGDTQIMEMLLDNFKESLLDVEQEEHVVLVEVVSRLGQFSISAAELRALLRLQEKPFVDDCVPEAVVKILATMAADTHQDLETSFLEFDMSTSGHTCAFVPAIARLKKDFGTASQVQSTERIWPYAGGTTISMWFRIVQYGMDGNPVRLVTFFTPTPECDDVHAEIAIDPDDLILTVQSRGEIVRFPACTFNPGKWTHLCVQFSKQKSRPMSVRVSVNGAMLEEAKLPPFSPLPRSEGQLAADLVCMRFGTGYAEARTSLLKWRLGPTYLLSDQVSENVIVTIYQLGPSYKGNLQGSLSKFQAWCSSPAPAEFVSGRRGQPFNAFRGKSLMPEGVIDLRTVAVPLVPESSFVFVLHAQAIAEINDTDALVSLGGSAANKMFCRELGLPLSTQQIRSICNRAMDGPAYAHVMNAVRTFVARPLHSVLDQVGGMSIVLKMIEDANTTSYLQSSVELFVLMVKSSAKNAREVELINGYAILGGMLSRKGDLLSRPTLDLLLSLTWPDQPMVPGVPAVALTRRSSLEKRPSKRKLSSPHHSSSPNITQGVTITNAVAFRELVMAFEVYRDAPEGLVRLVFSHLTTLVKVGPLQQTNITILRELDILPTCLAILSEKGTPATVAAEIIGILTEIFRVSMVTHDARQVGHLLINTLQDSNEAAALVDADTLRQLTNARHIILRALFNLLNTEAAMGIENNDDNNNNNNTNNNNTKTGPSIAEVLSKTLGPKFFLHFIRSKCDKTTVVLALQILSNLLSQNKNGFANKFNVVAGFTILADGMSAWFKLPEVHVIAFGLLLGMPVIIRTPLTELTVQTIRDNLDFSRAREEASSIRIEAFPVIVSLLEKLQHVSGFKESIAASHQVDVDEMFNTAGNDTDDDSDVLCDLFNPPPPPNPFANTVTTNTDTNTNTNTSTNTSTNTNTNTNTDTNTNTNTIDNTNANTNITGAADGINTNNDDDTRTTMASHGDDDDEDLFSIPEERTNSSHIPENPFAPPKPKNPFDRSPPRAPTNVLNNNTVNNNTVNNNNVNNNIVNTTVDTTTTVNNTVNNNTVENPFTPPRSPSVSTVSSTPERTTSHPFSKKPWMAVYLASIIDYLALLLHKSSKLTGTLANNPQIAAKLVSLMFSTGTLLGSSDTTHMSEEQQQLATEHADRVYGFLSLLNHSILYFKGDKACALFDGFIEHIPRVPVVVVKEFAFNLSQYLLKHVLESSMLVTPATNKQSHSLANLGRFTTCVTNHIHSLVCDKQGHRANIQTLQNTINTLWNMLRQVCDENGSVHRLSYSMLGKSTLQPVIECIVASCNRLAIALLVEAQYGYIKCHTATHRISNPDNSTTPPPYTTTATATATATTEKDMAFIYTFVSRLFEFALGQVNTDSILVPCLCRVLVSWNHSLSTTDAVMRDAVAAVWKVMLIRRPNQVSSLMKVKVDPKMGRFRTTNEVLEFVKSAHHQILENTTKHWATFESLESRIETSSHTVLGRRSANIIKEDKDFRNRNELISVFESRSSEKTCKTATVERRRKQDRRHRLIDHRRFITSMWSRLDADLHRERGIFGPTQTTYLEKWSQDDLEGPCRMRKLLRPNTRFYDIYTFDPDARKVVTARSKEQPMSKHSKEFQLLKQRPVSRCSHTWTVRGPSQLWTGFEEIAPADDTAVAEENLDDNADDDKSEGEKTSIEEDYIVEQILGAEDKRLWEVEAARATGLDANDGAFIFCEHAAYFAESYGISSSKKLFRRQQLEENSSRTDMVTKWGFEQIRDLRRRRYCLQDVAMELYSTDGKNSLLVFNDRATRDSVYDAFLAVASTLITTAKESVDGMQRDAKLEQNGIFSGLVGGRTVTQRWEAGEISNFEYLMHLNTLAGRSYNDLNQYPVFPWVLKDYTSAELDLEDTNSFRDFSKPMGAQTPTRAAAFKQRYNEWEDPTGENQPAFHYGTHYSSAQYVAGYLIRLEPFTQQFIKLQGGHFDHPDRMFHSIHENWMSASEKNNGDVKELIPEFFYLPEFLTNSNGFAFGSKQDGTVLGDVVLPPWAKGSADEFVRLHRAALESKHVSANLHNWIDLIFGSKQSGPEAEAALNVFHHLTYEGAIDIDNIDDPVKKAATISFINNFGQTPTQLFKRPHPPRRNIALPRDDDAVICPTNKPERLLTSLRPFKETSLPVGGLIPDKGGVLVCGEKQALIPPYFTRNLSWAWYEQSLESSSGAADKVTTVYEDLHQGKINCAVVLSSKMVITGASDCTVRAWVTTAGLKNASKGFVLQRTLCGHDGAITCLEVVQSFSLLISGAESGECIIWGDLTSLEYIRQLRHVRGPIVGISSCVHSGNLLTCDNNAIMLWTVNGKLLAASEKAVSKPSDSITSCEVSPLPEWSGDQMMFTGHRDGSIMAWMVQMSKQTESEQWKCELVALCRLQPPSKEGVAPSTVSKIKFSPDARKLFVGHMSGNIFSWGIPDTSGKSAEHWIRDSQVTNCMACKVKFNFSERRHHCRNCGKVFCNKCSSNEAEIPALNIQKAVRVCNECFDNLMMSVDVPPAINIDQFS